MLESYMNITAIIVVALWGLAPAIVILLLVQYYIHKKILDPTYYNTDHFSSGELVVLTTGFIFYIHKTLIYVRAIALPKTMRKRFKEDVLTYKEHPVIYLLACFTMLLIALGALSVINIFVFIGFYEYYN